MPAKDELPLLIKTNHQKSADFYAYSLAKKRGVSFEFISLLKTSNLDKVSDLSKDAILYLTDFHTLKKGDKAKVLDLVKDKCAVICSNDINEEVEGINTFEIKTEHKSYDDGDILSIEEYVKHVLLTHQQKFPDTELSKKLGISRKSLWEKRKKYGIVKKNAKK
jgi:DNA-binding NtrC family response regulator